MIKTILLTLLFGSVNLYAWDVNAKAQECLAGDAGSCDMAGFSYYSKGDNANALKYYTKGCELNFVSSCFGLSYMYLKGQGVDKDIAKATKLIEKACKGGYEDACEILKGLTPQ